jgi:hypothetical protein
MADAERSRPVTRDSKLVNQPNLREQQSHVISHNNRRGSVLSGFAGLI